MPSMDDGQQDITMEPLSGQAPLNGTPMTMGQLHGSKPKVSPEALMTVKMLMQRIQQGNFEAGRLDFEIEKLKGQKMLIHQRVAADYTEIDRLGQESAKKLGMDPTKCMMNVETGELIPRP